ncbi:YncE family protein [Kitasatospora sp. NPDC058190]|uniref:YncE family protein n=1 Tax=Kitasatospora sp. NPDC058190 TaxID=3346371 RepID=UPI0036D9EF53
MRTSPASSSRHPSHDRRSPDVSPWYFYAAGSDSVVVIDTATGQLTRTVTVGGAPWAVGVSPDGRRVYVTDTHANAVSVIDTELL